MDVTIQHPWFKRALGPFYPSRLFDQFFGEGLFEYDLLPFLSSTISPYYRQSLFRTVLDSGISEVRPCGGAGFSQPVRERTVRDVPGATDVPRAGNVQRPGGKCLHHWGEVGGGRQPESDAVFSSISS